MKTNIFRVREKKEKKIVIEEERTKNPLLLFIKRYSGCFTLFLLTLFVVSLLASVGIAFSLFRGSNDYDISYISGSEEITTNNDPDVDDDKVEEDLLGEVARAEGVIVLVESFVTGVGDVVSYYSDGTAVIVQADGHIYRVSPLDNGKYGVDRNGKISDSAKKKLVSATTNTLVDGTVVTYYSDGSARVELKEKVIFVRDSNNIKLRGGNNFSYVAPSGVALTNGTHKIDSSVVVDFTDGTYLVTSNGKRVIVNKNTEVSYDTKVSYDVNNSFVVIGEKKLDDGNIITHYSNGAATITDNKGNVIYVKKAGDIVIKNNKLYEIISNKIGYSSSLVRCPDGRVVVYFDNGAAVIIQPDGTRIYVADSDDIIYDGSKNIVSSPDYAKQIAQKKTTDGETVYNFDNGKSQVIKADGTSYIVDTNTLTFLPSGEIANKPVDIDKHNPPKTEDEYDPTEGIYVSEAENIYNKFRNIEDTTFIIRNDSDKRKKLRITIEEVSNYNKFNTRRLEPKFVKFQATVGDEYVSARKLTSNVWTNSQGKKNYVIYDGRLGAKSSVTVALSLYVDYAELSNFYQNTGFVGTINVYVEG